MSPVEKEMAFRAAESSALVEGDAGPQHCAQGENQFNWIFKIVFQVNFAQQFTKSSRDVIV